MLRTFWPKSQEQNFSQLWVLCRNTTKNINFHYRTNSGKTNAQIFQEIGKTLFLAHFGAIFPIFGAKKIFSENSGLSRTTSYAILAPCQNLEKINDKIPRKRPYRRKDGQTLFYRTLPATTGGPIRNSSKTLIDNIYSNVITPNYVSGTLTTKISDHPPQFLIPTDIYSNLPSTKLNIFERDWSRFD